MPSILLKSSLSTRHLEKSKAFLLDDRRHSSLPDDRYIEEPRRNIESNGHLPQRRAFALEDPDMAAGLLIGVLHEKDTSVSCDAVNSSVTVREADLPLEVDPVSALVLKHQQREVSHSTNNQRSHLDRVGNCCRFEALVELELLVKQ